MTRQEEGNQKVSGSRPRPISLVKEKALPESRDKQHLSEEELGELEELVDEEVVEHTADEDAEDLEDQEVNEETEQGEADEEECEDEDDDGDELPPVDLSDKIERMGQIEEMLGVGLGALSAIADGDYINVLGELHFAKPPDIENSIQVHVLVYDMQGRAAGKNYMFVGDAGAPFDSFDLSVERKKPITADPNVSRIRVYVKRGWTK